MSREDENYYLAGYDANADIIKHYRVDKILKIKAGPERLVEDIQTEIRRLMEQHQITQQEEKLWL